MQCWRNLSLQGICQKSPPTGQVFSANRDLMQLSSARFACSKRHPNTCTCLWVEWKTKSTAAALRLTHPMAVLQGAGATSDPRPGSDLRQDTKTPSRSLFLPCVNCSPGARGLQVFTCSRCCISPKSTHFFAPSRCAPAREAVAVFPASCTAFPIHHMLSN